MEVSLSEKAKTDLIFWKNSGNISIQRKITDLIESALLTPFDGLGKPEPLKFELSGVWSRRITKEHRMVYEIFNNKIFILSLKGHYK